MKTIEELKKLGFKNVASRLEAEDKFRTKTFLAYNNYEFISEEDYQAFNEELRAKTQVRDQYMGRSYYVYDKLVMTRLEEYPDLPPEEVLLELKTAQERECFDYYEIAKIESIREVIDPILFGRINGCTDRFFIAQWDHDVKFEDIKRRKESIDDL